MPRCWLILVLLLPLAHAQLSLQPETRIAIVGGVLAERMQHDGWLETHIHRRFPGHRLVVRHLGVAGDSFERQDRPEGFGTLDEHLSFCKADLIIACFDLHPQAPETLRTDVAEFAEHIQGQRYNGKSAPALVLVSPIACEARPDLDAESANAGLKPLVAVLAEFATARELPFVDLFAMSLAAYQQSGPYTINGSFLNSEGNRLVAAAIDRVLFGEAPREGPDPATVRPAVLEKNRLWFSRYRVADGSRVYGAQSRQVFGGLSNREVLLREQDIRAVMTENRDKAIWAVLAGEPARIDDSNTPEPIAVPLPDGVPEPRYADAESAIDLMTPAEGFSVSVFASEEQFRELRNPAALAVDVAGRLWVASVAADTQVPPKSQEKNAILILDDSDRDGSADSATVFADELGVITGFTLLHDGVLVASPPDLLLLRDTDGDDKADSRQRVLHGLASADIDGAANSLQLGPDGWVYYLESAGQASQVAAPHGTLRNNSACVWRWHPGSGQLQRHAPFAANALRGQAVDNWGNRLVFDPSIGFAYRIAAVTGHLDAGAHAIPPAVNSDATPHTQGILHVSGGDFSTDLQGQMLVCGLGIRRFEFGTDGARELDPLLVSKDENFHPVDLAIGADGALYVAEWQSPVLGHQIRHVRDPQRDSSHGRIYRIGTDRPAPKAAEFAKIPQLLELLKSPSESLRQRARLALDGHAKETVLAAAGVWLSKLPAEVVRPRVELLWLYQRRQSVNETLLRTLLRSPAPEARAAAVRVLRDWRLPDDLQLLRSAVADSDARVRLEAVTAASFRKTPDAATVALEVLSHPLDISVQHALAETIRQLNPIWQAAKNKGPLFADNPAGIAFLLASVSSDELLALPRTEAVQRAMLVRVGIPREQRQAAIVSLAASTRQPAAKLLVEAVAAADAAEDDATEAVIAELGEMLREALGAGVVPRTQLRRLLVNARRSQTRQLVFALLIEIDGNPVGVWATAVASLPALADFISSAHGVATLTARATLFDYLLPLMSELPANLEPSPPQRDALHAAALAALATIPGREEEKFAEFSALISLGQQVSEAVEAMEAIPGDKWPQDQLLDAVDGIAIFARGRGAAGREEPDVVAALKLGEALAARLPDAEAARAREALQDLGGLTITIKALPNKLLFDVRSFTVEAGQPVELVFHNADTVRRNLAIAAPGTTATIGVHVDTRKEGPPPRLLWDTKMLAPGSSARLAFTAPLEPGDYPFLCTMPDIWRSMSGVMKVVIP